MTEMLPADFTPGDAINAALELARLRDDLQNATHQSGRYLAKLPECQLKTEYAQLHAEMLEMHERAKVFVEAGKQALMPFYTLPAAKPRILAN